MENNKNTTLFFRKIIKTIQAVPKGKVATYGQIAELSGYKGYARHVGWILNSSSKKYNLPWHRIINAKGNISMPRHLGYGSQILLLKKEGIKISKDNIIDLKIYQWSPKSTLKKVKN